MAHLPSGTVTLLFTDIETARELGATEIAFWPGYGTGELSLETYFELLEQLPQLVERLPQPV